MEENGYKTRQRFIYLYIYLFIHFFIYLFTYLFIVSYRLIHLFFHHSWWLMFRHLGFSLVGLSEFHPVWSADLPAEALGQILYAAFLIWGVILLINMLIALLSHTYEQTEVRKFILSVLLPNGPLEPRAPTVIDFDDIFVLGPSVFLYPDRDNKLLSFIHRWWRRELNSASWAVEWSRVGEYEKSEEQELPGA